MGLHPFADFEVAEAILERLPTDRYLSRMVKPLGVPLPRLIAVCRRHGIRYPNRHASDDEIARAIRCVTIDGMTMSAAAATVGISRSAVHRYVCQRRRAYSTQGLSFVPLDVAPYRCPRHGIVRVSPCIACEVLDRSGKLR